MAQFRSWNRLEDWMDANVPMYTRVVVLWNGSPLAVFRNEHNTFAALTIVPFEPAYMNCLGL